MTSSVILWEYIQSAIVSSQPPDTDIKQRRDTGCFFTGSALKVLSMELVPPKREKMTGSAIKVLSIVYIQRKMSELLNFSLMAFTPVLDFSHFLQALSAVFMHRSLMCVGSFNFHG